MAENFDWDGLGAKLPTAKNEEDKARKKELWEKTLGFGDKQEASLEELITAMGTYLAVPEEIGAKKPVKLAFQEAIKWKEEKIKALGTFTGLHVKQFRAFLVSLKAYFELWRMFITIDTSGDRKIQLEEFVAAVPKLEKWGVKLEDPQAAFKAIDVNNGGTISFHEFSAFALKEVLKYVDEE